MRSLDYCRVNGCDADGDYSIISNCTRQHLQMEPCVLAKRLLGSQLFIQQWWSELADIFPYELKRNLKYYKTEMTLGVSWCTFQASQMPFTASRSFFNNVPWKEMRYKAHIHGDKIKANLITLVTHEYLDMLVFALDWDKCLCVMSCTSRKELPCDFDSRNTC